MKSSDVAAIFDRALSELIDAHSRRKMAVVRRPTKARVSHLGGQAGRRALAARRGRGQARSLGPGRRSLRIRRCERPPLQRACLPRIPPRRALRGRRQSDDRQHPAPLSRAQRIRGGRVLRNRSQEPGGRLGGRAFRELRCFLGFLARSGTGPTAALPSTFRQRDRMNSGTTGFSSEQRPWKARPRRFHGRSNAGANERRLTCDRRADDAHSTSERRRRQGIPAAPTACASGHTRGVTRNRAAAHSVPVSTPREPRTDGTASPRVVPAADGAITIKGETHVRSDEARVAVCWPRRGDAPA